VTNHLLLAALVSLAPLAAAGAAPAPGAPAAPRPAAVPAAAPADAARPAAVAAPPEEAPAETTYVHLKAPLFSERFETFPVAQVEDQFIELRELTSSLAAAHQAHDPKARPDTKDFTALLDRLIDARLLVLDARDSGIDELPEVKRAIADFRETALTEALKAYVTRAVKADPEEVERLYRREIREWKVTSVLFAKPEDAKRAAGLVAGGKSLDDVGKRAIEEKKATGGDQTDFVPAARMLPAVAAAVDKLAVGRTSPPIQVTGGWAIVRLDAVRYPEKPGARADAEAKALAGKKVSVLRQYYADLARRWVKIDQRLLKRLDYEAPRPGFEVLKKDERPLVRIQGEPPITVGRFSAALEQEFFHGVAEAIRAKRINRQKPVLLDALVSRVVVPKEARRLGLDATAEYERKVADYESSLLFGTYVEKAIAPNVKVPEEELKAYYEQHRAEYAYPAFYRLEGMGFRDVKLAQAAVEKLRAGTDFKWLKANAEGQIPNEERTVVMDGGVYSARGMPPDMVRGLAGAKKGDFRLHSAGDQHYVVHVLEEVHASEQPFAEVRKSILQKVTADHVGKAIKETAGKLRGIHDVRVFITRIGG